MSQPIDIEGRAREIADQYGDQRFAPTREVAEEILTLVRAAVEEEREAWLVGYDGNARSFSKEVAARMLVDRMTAEHGAALARRAVKGKVKRV